MNYLMHGEWNKNKMRSIWTWQPKHIYIYTLEISTYIARVDHKTSQYHLSSTHTSINSLVVYKCLIHDLPHAIYYGSTTVCIGILKKQGWNSIMVHHSWNKGIMTRWEPHFWECPQPWALSLQKSTRANFIISPNISKSPSEKGLGSVLPKVCLGYWLLF